MWYAFNRRGLFSFAVEHDGGWRAAAPRRRKFRWPTSRCATAQEGMHPRPPGRPDGLLRATHSRGIAPPSAVSRPASDGKVLDQVRCRPRDRQQVERPSVLEEAEQEREEQAVGDRRRSGRSTPRSRRRGPLRAGRVERSAPNRKGACSGVPLPGVERFETTQASVSPLDARHRAARPARPR